MGAKKMIKLMSFTDDIYNCLSNLPLFTVLKQKSYMCNSMSCFVVKDMTCACSCKILKHTCWKVNPLFVYNMYYKYIIFFIILVFCL